MPRRYKSKGLNEVEKKQVKRIARGPMEIKHHSEYGSDIEANSSGTVIDLTTVTQGDTDLTRDGDQIYLKDVEFSGVLQRDTNPTSPDRVRVVLFQWKPGSNLAAPAVSDILYDTDTARITLSPFNFDDMPNFKVLADRLYTLEGYQIQSDTVQGDTYMRSIKRVKFNFSKQLLKKQQYDAGTSDSTNKLYLMIVGDKSTGNSASSMEYYCTTRFYDA